MLILHRELLLDYLQNFCASQALRAAILKDFKHHHILRQLAVLALLGKLVTGPWMSKFYGTSSNLDLSQSIKTSVQTLKEWALDPQLAVNSVTNVFGEDLPQDRNESEYYLFIFLFH